jgi:hypothetical protein
LPISLHQIKVRSLSLAAEDGSRSARERLRLAEQLCALTKYSARTIRIASRVAKSLRKDPDNLVQTRAEKLLLNLQIKGHIPVAYVNPSEKRFKRFRKGSRVEHNKILKHEYLSNHPCVDCGEARVKRLDFDHVRGEKIANISDMMSLPWEWILTEIAKCVVRCSGCHRDKPLKIDNALEQPESGLDWYVLDADVYKKPLVADENFT